MASNSNRGALAKPDEGLFRDLLLPDGKHSGVRIDARRLILEVQRRGTRYYFDLTQIVDFAERLCYTDEQITPP